MLGRVVIETVVRPIAFVYGQVVAATGRADVFAVMVARFQLGEVVEDGKGHGRGGDGAVLAAKRSRGEPFAILYKAQRPQALTDWP